MALRRGLPRWAGGEDGAAAGGGAAIRLGPHGPAPAVVFDGSALQSVEVAQHIAPLRAEAGAVAAFVEFLAQDQRQERTEHMAAGRRILVLRF